MRVISVSRNKGGWSDSPITLTEQTMNIGQVIQKVLDAIAAFKNGDIMGAAIIVLGVVQAILAAMPTVGVRRAVHAGMDYDAMTVDELIDELEKQVYPHMASQSTMTGSATGPIIDAVLPILFALLKKWLGL